MREQFQALAGIAGSRSALFRLLGSPAGSAAVQALAPRLRTSAGAIGHLIADTVTPTQLHAGHRSNVVPGEARATLDCRLLPDEDVAGFVARLNRLFPGVDVRETARAGGPVSGRGGLYRILEEVSRGLASRPLCVPSLTPALTDLRLLRARGAAAYGWVPAILSPELLATVHGHDERMPVDELESAVAAMTRVVLRAAGA